MRIWIILISLFSLDVRAEDLDNLCNAGMSVEASTVKVFENTERTLPYIRRYAESSPKGTPNLLNNPILDRMLETQMLVVNAGLGDVRQVKSLLLKGVYVDSRRDEPYYTALTLAAICGRVDVVKLLVNSGADVNSYTPYFTGYSEQVSLFTTLSIIKNLNPDLVYSEENKKEIIKILESSGAKEDKKEVDIRVDASELQPIIHWFIRAGLNEKYMKSELVRNSKSR